MPRTQAARRYAKALLSLAQEQGAGETIGVQLGQVAEFFADPELAKILALPALPVSVRQDIVARLVAQGSPHEIVEKFLRVLADSDRLQDISAINEAYQQLLDKALGRVRAQVRSAVELAAEEKQLLVQTFSQLTEKTVEPTFETDAALLGGVVVEVEGRVYDASLKTQLARLGEQLARQI